MAISDTTDIEKPQAGGWLHRLGRFLGWEPVWVSLVLGLFIAVFMSGPLLKFGSTYYAATDILQSFPVFLIEEKPFFPHNYTLSDDIVVVLPWREFAMHSLGQFQIPLWQPYNGGGRPFLANIQTAIFNPVNWLHFILGHRWGFLLVHIVQLYLMGMFSHLYFRTLRIPAEVALIGAIACTYLGFMVVWLGGTQPSTFLLFPLSLALLELRLSNRWANSRFAIAFSLVIAWEVFAGHPEIILLNNVCAGLYLLYRLLTLPRAWGNWAARARLMGLFVGSGLFGALLAAVQLLPFLEYTANSFAVVARSSEKGEPFGSHKLLSFLLPNPYGNPTYGFDLDFAQPVYSEISGGYVGPTIIFLAICALWLARRNLLTWFYVGGTLVGLSIVYGYWPIFQLVVRASLISVAQQRMMGYMAFFLVALAMLGLQGSGVGEKTEDKKFTVYPLGGRGRDLPPTGARPRFTIKKFKPQTSNLKPISQSSVLSPQSLFLALAAVAFLAAMGGIFWWFSGSGLVPFERGSVQRFEIPQFLFICGLFIASVVGLVGALRFPRYAGIGLIVVGLALFGQLGLFGRVYRAATNEAYFYPRTATLAAVAQSGGRVATAAKDNIFPPEVNIMYGIEQINSYDALEVRWMNALVSGAKGRWPAWDNPIPLNLFNIKQLIAYSSDPNFQGIEATNTKQLRRASKQRNINLYENQNYQPPFRMVYQAVERDEAQASAELLDGTINPLDTLVFIKGVAPPLMTEHPTSSPPVKVVSRTANRITLSVNNPQPGYLYLDQTWFPGWQAQVNGQNTPLYRANYAFTALPVGAGELNIVVEYDPLSFKLGAIISLLAALTLLGFGLGLKYWKRRR